MKKNPKTEFSSALEDFTNARRRPSVFLFLTESLDLQHVVRLRPTLGNQDFEELDLDACLKHGIDFVRGTTGPLFTQLDPEKLGEYSRALAVGSEYGERLLRRFTPWDDEKRAKILEKLVHGYPSHEYIIDYHELKEIGFNVDLFSSSERAAAQQVLAAWNSQTVVSLIVPKKTSPEQQADPEVATS